MNIADMTIGEIGINLVELSVIAGCVLGLFRLWYRFNSMERQGGYRQEDTAMIFKCLRACLLGQIQNGANGEVRDALRELNDYMSEATAGLRTKK
ncbi:MAG: hypothetical protein FWG72_01950 [Oscillospiraceae bacterium]|nr:hypothetical protein [Oscillospiraceae bacterium]